MPLSTDSSAVPSPVQGTLDTGPARLADDVDRIRVSVPPDPSFRAVLRLVLGGIGGRSHLSYDQVDELQLALNALFARRQVVGDAAVVEAEVSGGSVVALVGPFTVDADAVARRVLESLVDEVRMVQRDDAEWVELRVNGHGPPAHDA
jgi:hypothetical protein